MPDWLTQAFFNPELQRQRLNVHQYRENDNVITMRILDDLHLADFVELQLKSKHDFDAAYDVALSAGLGDYVRRFVVANHLQVSYEIYKAQSRAWRFPCRFKYGRFT